MQSSRDAIPKKPPMPPSFPFQSALVVQELFHSRLQVRDLPQELVIRDTVLQVRQLLFQLLDRDDDILNIRTESAD
jgi:hypothetical protein